MRTLAAFLFAALASPAAIAGAEAQTSAPPVSLQVTVGYSGMYRVGPQWVPVRVALRNRSGATIDGQVIAEGNGQAASPYAMDVVLPPGERKQVSLYLPSESVGNGVTVNYAAGGRSITGTMAYPDPLPDLDLMVGALTDDPGSVSWLARVHPAGTHLHTVLLPASQVDAVPQALATFDAIVLSGVDTSKLDTSQLRALEEYVRDGGSLILVGGPDWQITFAGLPDALIPGRPGGSRTITSLASLSSLGAGAPPATRMTVSVLSHPDGAVLATSGGLPLLSEAPFGDGLLAYLAFDPSDPWFGRWPGASRFLTRLTTAAMPLSMRRLALNPGDRTTSFLFPGSQPIAVDAELANLSNPALPVIVSVLAALGVAVLAVVVLGFALRRWQPRLTWIAFPLLVLLATGGFLRTAPALARSQGVVNTLSVVRLQGEGPAYPAERYVGLYAPLAGRYRLEYDAPALIQDVASLYPVPFAGASSAVLEGAHPTVDLGNMEMWSTRGVVLRTTVTIPGRVETRLAIGRDGYLTGTVSNGTELTLKEPAVVAGRAFQRLPDIAAHSTMSVRFEPRDDVLEHDTRNMLARIYGMPGPGTSGAPVASRSGDEPGLRPEQSLSDRIPDAIGSIPETQLLSLLGEVTLVAWSDATLEPVSVNGTSVRHRDLTLFMEPASMAAPSGSFRLLSGTVGAYPLAVTPVRPHYACCGGTPQPISLGAGGSATFAFTLPTAGHIHVRRLTLHVYAGGEDTSYSGYTDVPRGDGAVYDWRTRRWFALSFRDGAASLPVPDRFVSVTGALLLRLHATSVDLTILDPHQDLQVEGTAR